MGNKISDGKAIDVQAPGATVINDGDMYRISGFTGFAIGKKDGVQTDLGMALEVDTNAVWSVKLPAALNPAVGTNLKWSAGAGFKKGDTDLIAGGALETGVCKVVAVKNAAGYAQVRLTGQIPEV
jgi:hypothetical protein